MTKSWKIQYRQKLINIDTVVEKLSSNWRVIFPTLAGAPNELIIALSRAVREKRASNFKASMILPASNVTNSLLRVELEGRFQWDSLFCGPGDRAGVNKGVYQMTPMHFSEMPGIMSKWKERKAVMALVSEPDEDGFMSLGISIDYTKSLINRSDYCVVEVNPNVPRVFGNCQVHVSDVDAIVESKCPILELPNPPLSSEDKAIGSLISERISDGATIQLGYGAVPSAVANFLTSHNNLGIHTEMFVDNMRMLMECGAVNNSSKTVNPGKSIYTFCAGTSETYRFLHENHEIEGHPVEYTNDPYIISKHKSMVTINAIIAVDLTGQVCSESIGFLQYSGSGGQVDFVRGANLSENGQSFLATHSTAKNGHFSSIVDVLPEGSVVTTPRTDVDMVVTEYGIAELKGRNLSDRAQLLIKIAHPKFRDELQKSAYKRGLISGNY